jgi:hypothetical protein
MQAHCSCWPIEMQPDMRGFRGCMGKRDGAIKCSARLVSAADLHKQRTAHTEEPRTPKK